MKLSIRQCLACLLAAAVATGTAGCGKSETESVPSDNQEEKTYTFSIYRNGSFPTYPANGGEGVQIMKDAMKAYGLPDINVDVTLIGGEEYFDKLNVLAASSSLPDYFHVDQVTLANFADQELIIPVEEYIDDMPAYRDRIRQSEIDAILYNGHQYAFTVGYLEGAINGPNTDGLIIRQDWLDKLGLSVPTTLDELHDVLYAFTYEDPDGNGKDDTYGYLGIKTTLFEDIFGAYGIQPTFWMQTEDGLRLGSTLPATKDALQTLQDWYAEGLIDPDIFTADQALKEQKYANSKGGVYEGNGFSCDPSNPDTAALLSVTPEARVTGLAAITGPEGKSGRQESSPGYGNLNAISASCEHPDVLVQLLNWCTDDGENGGMFLCSQGVEGEDFEFTQDGERITMLSTYDEIYAKGLGNPVRFLQIVDRRWMADGAVECFENFDGSYRTNAYWGTTPTMLTYPDTTKNLFREYLAKIVMGTESVDAWEKYLDEFSAMGGDQITQEVNDIYNQIHS